MEGDGKLCGSLLMVGHGYLGATIAFDGKAGRTAFDAPFLYSLLLHHAGSHLKKHYDMAKLGSPKFELA